MALGLTAVILMGELDLSVASTLAVSGVVMASVPNIWLGIAAALAVGLVIGAVNAFFVVKVGINSFIATLGMLFVLRGLAFVLSDEKPVRLTDIEAGIAFGRPLVGPITPRILLFVLVFVALQVFVTRMRVGPRVLRRRRQPAGRPRRRHPGRPPGLHRLHDLGLRRGAGGVVNTLELTAADPTAGSTVLLASFAAAIIGGVALTGGRGSIVGTLLGALVAGDHPGRRSPCPASRSTSSRSSSAASCSSPSSPTRPACARQPRRASASLRRATSETTALTLPLPAVRVHPCHRWAARPTKENILMRTTRRTLATTGLLLAVGLTARRLRLRRRRRGRRQRRRRGRR